MTCAKKQVRANIMSKLGQCIGTGTNWCGSPQDTCPRKPGDDYTLCKTVCRQPAHAEVQAVRDAIRGGYRKQLYGATIHITHTHMCEGCKRALAPYNMAIVLEEQ